MYFGCVCFRGELGNITILLLHVDSQWAIKTESSKDYSHLELIGVQHECDNISMICVPSDVRVGNFISLIDVLRRGTANHHPMTSP